MPQHIQHSPRVSRPSTSRTGCRPVPLPPRRISQLCSRRLVGIAALLLTLLGPSPALAQETTPHRTDGAPVLVNPGFECGAGYESVEAPQGGIMQIPTGWRIVFLEGTPWLHSARMQYNSGSCGGSAHVEKIEGDDSLALFAHDLEWSDRPGKPFDVAVYQQVDVVAGRAYSLSAWMLSLCGGSTMPNDCPPGVYMSKMLGIDPTGGIDPLADTVVWTTNNQNFVENDARVGWINLRTSALAESNTITVFGRIHSPFQWHGNHAFIDSFSLVEAPHAEFDPQPPAQVNAQSVELTWSGQSSQHIEVIPSGTYELVFDLQVRLGHEGEWRPWRSGEPGRRAVLHAQALGIPHFVRVRSRAVQPAGVPGAWPNHRYPGLWSDAAQIVFRADSSGRHAVYLTGLSK